ncbi:hypothetical protein NC653_022184 [Populus alba x Populus x berolinensis]|nr:hypothetical protein NC653_022184 [Populus alba x Populus x berolinensis]
MTDYALPGSSPPEQSNGSVPSTLQYRTTIDRIEQLLVNGLSVVSLVSVSKALQWDRRQWS